MKIQSTFNTKKIQAGFYVFIMISLIIGTGSVNIRTAYALENSQTDPISSVNDIHNGPPVFTADEDGGNDQCTNQCHSGGDTTPPPPAAICGNGVREEAEQCDDGNTVSGDGCSATCTVHLVVDEIDPIDVDIIFCGNGIVEAGEHCDEGANNGVSPFTCSAQCRQIHVEDPIAECGNGLLETGEQCDGTDFGSASCSSHGFTNGTLTCTSACTLNTNQCFNQGGSGGSVQSSSSSGGYVELVLSDQSTNSITTGTAVVTWKTNKGATSRVIYDVVSRSGNVSGPNYGYSFSTTVDTTTVTSHSVTLTGLEPGATYYWKPVSSDGTEKLGIESSFTTSSVVSPAETVITPTSDTEDNNPSPAITEPAATGSKIVTRKSSPKILGFSAVVPVAEAATPVTPLSLTPQLSSENSEIDSSFTDYLSLALIILIILALIVMLVRRAREESQKQDLQ